MNPSHEVSPPLLQTHINLIQRIKEIPGCNERFIQAANDAAAEDHLSLDPISLLWRTLRSTTLLINIYNFKQKGEPLQIDELIDPAKRPKVAAFKFVEACQKVLHVPREECFAIRDIFGDDVTGFMKVIRLINRVLDGTPINDLPMSPENGLENPTSTIPTPSPPATPRRLVIQELVHTERAYIQSLSQLHNLKTLISQ
ncbi:CDC24 calponin-domain-containing protein [Cadophora sp. MPI-SDFR-AT-0126]|nr:CDC24 calponin-domain-containing protein [Leotiomycetes sp. MPI-SDFR-AT-0126]